MLILTMKVVQIIAVKCLCKNANKITAANSKTLLARILQKCTAFIHIQTKRHNSTEYFNKKYSCLQLGLYKYFKKGRK